MSASSWLGLPQERSADDILWDVVEQHLEESAFLWSQWERCLLAPDYSLEEVAERIEERLFANIQGLICGGAPVADRLLLPVLANEEDDQSLLSAVSQALLDGWEEKRIDLVLERLIHGTRSQRLAIQRSLELAEHKAISARMEQLLKKQEPDVVGAVLEIMAFRGMELEMARLESFLTSAEPAVVAGALRLLRSRWPRGLRPEVLNRLLVRPEVRDPALEVGLMYGYREAWLLCRELLSARQPGSRVAMVMMALGGSRDEGRLVRECLANPELQADALWALGFSGHFEDIEACVEFLDNPQHARLAGEAFSAITGLELKEQFVRDPEEDVPQEPIPLEEEELDADLLPPAEAHLPVPEAGAVRAWWKDSRRSFSIGTRYASGKPFGMGGLLAALETAPMRRRHVLAQQLAVMSRGALQINTFARTQVQARQLDRAREESV